MNKPIIDTNVIVRLLTGEPEDKAAAARSFFESVDRGDYQPFLATVVVAEVLYVLTSFYEFDKGPVVDALRNLITSPNITVQDQALVLKALAIYREKNIHFVDSYAAAYSLKNESQVVSFDTDFDKIAGCQRLTPH